MSGRRSFFGFGAAIFGHRRSEPCGPREIKNGAMGKSRDYRDCQEALMRRRASDEGDHEDINERLAQYSEVRRPIFQGADLLRGKTVEQGIHLLESVNDHDLDKGDTALKHVQLGIAYAKKGDIEKSNFHYRKAIEYGHSTGWAYEKLAINLTKQGKLEEAIDVCQQIIDHPNIPEPRSYLTKDDMQKRKNKLEAKVAAQRKQGAQ